MKCKLDLHPTMQQCHWHPWSIDLWCMHRTPLVHSLAMPWIQGNLIWTPSSMLSHGPYGMGLEVFAVGGDNFSLRRGPWSWWYRVHTWCCHLKCLGNITCRFGILGILLKLIIVWKGINGWTLDNEAQRLLIFFLMTSLAVASQSALQWLLKYSSLILGFKTITRMWERSVHWWGVLTKPDNVYAVQNFVET